MDGVLRFLSHAFERQLRAHEVALLPEPSIRDSMVDSSESLISCIEDGEIVGIRGHIAIDGLNSGCGGMQFALEGLSWFVEDVPEKDVSSCIVEETNKNGANAYGALVRVRSVTS
jgi:hypothetical protein